MLPLFALTIFLAAFLLFLVQPMAARLILPLLGGSPAVWNTAMVFFQFLLLGGYLYAHLLSRLASLRTQLIVHAVVLLAGAAMLPIALPADLNPAGGTHPALFVLTTLALAVGAPFLVISSAGPLLQAWFSRSDHRAAANPYFLYAASNLGSMLALIGYPLLVEPGLTLAQQRWGWSIAYVLFGALALIAGSMAMRRPRPLAPTTAAATTAATTAPIETVSWLRRLRWITLALIPSSLMLGCTHYVTSDVGSFPLLWIVPLATYLLTFILVFGPGGRIIAASARGALPIAAIGICAMLIIEPRQPLIGVLAAHSGFLLIAGLACHGLLADDRPHPARLTEFYLCLSIGGVIGGMINSLLAPLIFNSIAEYPIVIVLAVLMGTATFAFARVDAARPWKIRLAGMLDVAMPALVLGAYVLASRDMLPASIFPPHSPVRDNAVWLLPAILCVTVAAWRFRLALCIAVMAAIPAMEASRDIRVLHQERTFFGVLRVFTSDSSAKRTDRVHTLWHGRTEHGAQNFAPELEREPTTYYTRSGPVGDVITELRIRPMPGSAAMDPAPPATSPAAQRPLRLAFVGLGAGTMAAYLRPNDVGTFYEIDPAVVRLASDRRLFTFIANAQSRPNFVIGDARVTLAQADGQYDAIVLDAFSSDAIPVHLLTREAISMYLDKLAPGGILLVHISNRYLDLEPVLALAANELGLSARLRDDVGDHADRDPGVLTNGSEWVALSRLEGDLGSLLLSTDWYHLRPSDKVRLWTDDYTDIWSVLSWRNPD
ncbi:MAG: fused MFS/spermidine synthase [Phycisphaerales bacterium]|jgi:SAM-dependent methyltransferase|nr:fused MFS/spermidine synthase [Phycisphaeraceae bacterium]